jgi:hypothetical protein
VFSKDFDSERMCLVTILTLASLGLIAGFMTWTDTRGTRLSTVMAARYLPEDKPSGVPRLPRGVFLSLLFALVPLIKGWCVLLPIHNLFAAILILLCISAAAWLLAASALEGMTADERKERIEQFIASEPGNEPPVQPRVESFPTWLRWWEGINLTAYFLMMALMLYSLFALSDSSLQ